MKKTITVILILIFIIAGGYFIFLKETPKSEPNIPKFQAFLMNRGFSGAVVQQLFSSNLGSVWIIKEKKSKFLYSADLGKICDPVCRKNYDSALTSIHPWETTLSPDKSFVIQLQPNYIPAKGGDIEGGKPKTYGLTSEFTTIQSYPSWENIKLMTIAKINSILYRSSCASAAFSPDGRWLLRSTFDQSENLRGTEIIDKSTNLLSSDKSKVQKLSNIQMCDIAWSDDGTYAITRDYGEGEFSGLWIYDKTSNSLQKISTIHNDGYSKIVDVLSRSEVILSRSEGTYLVDISSPISKDKEKLLNQNIKLLGVIH